ncbi:MAG: hypothetical protein PUF03_01365 [Lachnospiraceae bacterium]|nr:hypothetical protein [Lachnospiraceae bacterium]
MDNKEMMESEYTYKDKPINTRIKKEQDRIEEEVVKIALGKEPGFKAIDSFYLNYGTDAEYLVEGAVLTCDRATTEVKVIGGQVFQNTAEESVTEKKRTVLKVSPNATLCNGLMMATIKDREIGTNIEAFHCNCEYGPSNDEELHAILEDVENCKQYGTCQKLMKLNDDWENIIKINAGGMDTGYQSYSHTSADGITEQADGITMASMLFCSHGGLITPVRSGQTMYAKVISQSMGKKVGYLKYGGEEITDDPTEGYYILYDGPTVVGIGDNYRFIDIYKDCKMSPNGALQGYGGSGGALNTEGGHTTYGGVTEMDWSKGILVHNGIERHTIALGPKLQNPDFDTSTTEDIDPAQMAYGTCVDVTIELEGKTYYIPAIITDVKAHTAYEGYCQTNKTFTGEIDGVSEGNIVEWYVIQKENNQNKSEGLDSYSENGGLIIYRDEVMK